MNFRNKLFKSSVLIMFFLFMAAPFIMLSGAAKGICLWFNVVLPSMLPCIIISNIVVNTYGQEFKRPWCYIIFTGLLCGYPMGAKSCADIYGKRAESASRTQFLLAVCNYSSPMFITNYCIAQTLLMKERIFPLLFILYFPVLLCLIFEIVRNRKFYFDRHSLSITSEKTAHLTVEIIDSSIMNGFEIITKLGGYIILFSIFSEFVQKIPLINNISKIIICGIVEITTGTALTCSADISDALKIILVTEYIAFGGLSCAAQTKSVIDGTFYSIKKYTCHKLLLAALTMLTAIIVTRVCKF